jgi:hypothetical protein
MTLATDLGVPRSTARGWLGKAPKVVVSLDVTDLRESELQQEVLELRPVNSVAVLVEASQGATSSAMTPVVLADAGVENVNPQIDDLIATGVLRRVLAFTELKFSNSMIEAWWRSLKHQWLFLHSLDSVTTVRRLVEFYVQEHNQVLPIRPFADRRLTRCTSAEGTRSQQT